MNNVKNVKYGLTPGKIEKKNHFLVKDFKTIFNMHRIKKTKLLHDRLKRYDNKKYYRKKEKIKGKLGCWRESFSSC